ncbi:UNVERIFIED_CONTAM: hypothetical protein Sangu_2935100 [Sesamum angustifolium]|uniref:Uncharacterized protein n=1 Tax=Sesamum angustifolium TaxID=2727405 RepID=A0AAW2IKJ6_9LAMI
MMAPKENGREVPCKVDVEYEWAPPKCVTCMSLGHTIAACSANKPVAHPPMAVYVKKTGPSNEQRYTTKINAEGRGDGSGDTGPNLILDEPGWTRDEDTGFGKELVLYNRFDVLVLGDNTVECSTKGPKECSPPMVLLCRMQFIHYKLFLRRFHITAFVTVVYGANESGTRRDLRQSVGALVSSITDDPWLLISDFNTVLDMSELCGKSGDIWVAMEDFKQFLTDTALINLPMQGFLFTWHNYSDGNQSLWKRLDRMFVNDKWLAH